MRVLSHPTPILLLRLYLFLRPLPLSYLILFSSYLFTILTLTLFLLSNFMLPPVVSYAIYSVPPSLQEQLFLPSCKAAPSFLSLLYKLRHSHYPCGQESVVVSFFLINLILLQSSHLQKLYIKYFYLLHFILLFSLITHPYCKHYCKSLFNPIIHASSLLSR